MSGEIANQHTQAKSTEDKEDETCESDGSQLAVYPPVKMDEKANATMVVAMIARSFGLVVPLDI